MWELRRGFSLLCVLDLSPTGRSPLEVTQRRLVLSGRAALHIIPSARCTSSF